ncbi:MAG: hypothetical protein IJN55_08085 [Alistipes sp.]|nr:hypothetical protein [Alistipes sp.]
MRQFTTPEQTAELIELGFEKPKSIKSAIPMGFHAIWCDRAYSIGELIEILPTYCWYKYGDKAYRAQLKIFFALSRWRIAYRKFEDDHVGHLYGTQGDELIDALYDMCIKLKEENYKLNNQNDKRLCSQKRK